MDNKYLHTFRLAVEGLAEPVEFQMFHELEDVATVTDSFAKYVARQEDDFLPIGVAGAVRASRAFQIAHLKSEPTANAYRAQLPARRARTFVVPETHGGHSCTASRARPLRPRGAARHARRDSIPAGERSRSRPRCSERNAPLCLASGQLRARARTLSCPLPDGRRVAVRPRAIHCELPGPAGAIPEMIVVGVVNTDRTRDTGRRPTRTSRRTAASTPAPTSGGADRFLTSSSRSSSRGPKRRTAAPPRVFAGYPRRALRPARLRRPALLPGRVLAVEPWLIWDEGKGAQAPRTFLTTDAAKTRALYFTLGNEGPPMQSALTLAAAARLVRDPPALGHEALPEESHSAVLGAYDGLRFVFDGWMLPFDPRIGAPSRHRRRRAEALRAWASGSASRSRRRRRS